MRAILTANYLLKLMGVAVGSELIGTVDTWRLDVKAKEGTAFVGRCGLGVLWRSMGITNDEPGLTVKDVANGAYVGLRGRVAPSHYAVRSTHPAERPIGGEPARRFGQPADRHEGGECRSR